MHGALRVGGAAAIADVHEKLFKQIPWESLKPVPNRLMLGAGSSGNVYYANWYRRPKDNPIPVAVKILKIGFAGQGDAVYNMTVEKLNKEAKALQDALDEGHNDYVVKFLGVGSGFVNEEWKTYLGRLAPMLTISAGGGEKMVALVTKFEEGGTLHDMMHGKELGPNSENREDHPHVWVADTRERLRLLLQIATGLYHLHNGEPYIVHADLKSENILLSDRSHVRLADLGLATLNELRETAGQSSARGTERDRVEGTYPYMAPELFRLSRDKLAEKPSRSSDIYAFGTITWEVLSGHLPWKEYTEVDRLMSISRGENLDLEQLKSDVGPEIRELIAQCLSFDRVARPRIDRVRQVLEHSLNTIIEGKFDIFLSYAWGKKDWRKPLADQMYKRLVDEGYRTWIDIHGGGAGEMRIDLDESMRKGIENSQCVVLLLSNEYLRSRACGLELDHIINTGKTLYICVVEPEKQGFWAFWKKGYDNLTTDEEFGQLPSLFHDPVSASYPDSMTESEKKRNDFLCDILRKKMYADFKKSVLFDWTTESLTKKDRELLLDSIAFPQLLKNLNELNISKSNKPYISHTDGTVVGVETLIEKSVSGRDLQSPPEDLQSVSLEAETRALKYDMDIILRQNAKLEKEVIRLCDELDEVTKSISHDNGKKDSSRLAPVELDLDSEIQKIVKHSEDSEIKIARELIEAEMSVVVKGGGPVDLISFSAAFDEIPAISKSNEPKAPLKNDEIVVERNNGLSRDVKKKKEKKREEPAALDNTRHFLVIIVLFFSFFSFFILDFVSYWFFNYKK